MKSNYKQCHWPTIELAKNVQRLSNNVVGQFLLFNNLRPRLMLLLVVAAYLSLC